MSRLHEFWLGWRKEIVRGGFIFAAVLGIGLAATNIWGHIPANMAEHFNWGDFGNNFGDNFDGDEDDGDWEESFRWAGKIAPDHWAWIRNTNGPIEVELAEDDSFVVFADKRSRHSDVDDVEIRVVEHNGSVTVCALWTGGEAECGDNGAYRLKNTKKNDVHVRFRVLVPRGVKLDASTVNGPVDVEGSGGEVELATVNGRIEATGTGPLRATTVNGSIHAGFETMTSNAPVELKTVNGGIEVELPPDLNADLEASTVSGRVSTDLPIQLVGRVSPRQVKARIGRGGRRLLMTTVNGSIEITQHQQDDHGHK